MCVCVIRAIMIGELALGIEDTYNEAVANSQ